MISNVIEQCIISKTDMSLYFKAISSRLFTKYRLVTAGWPTSWPNAATIREKVSRPHKVLNVEDWVMKYNNECNTSAA